ncbi:Bug family tripartite tricarboxylate transporter substrate binding protein [Pollutimonas harenae]|uniref:Tripartite tricarboxylate transporter substrate binding protein n=1 Tax=Pollutimonas harenae TaxID=657015 RepID=A0A853GQV8_9BURK|nr:tripartite tricarboxylate transporter substrate binding protein [Pollutimonas harenae]NYT84541.1 tripartite tricarboxylate transporter substrate binding protein [Pollutimonas harenae]TEA73065.1 tripartite tricarboxylate transporter substrate binding protein [Pollutimonas harenae]
MIKSIAATICLVLAHITAFADSAPETYPEKPVRFLVPYTPGGNADMIVRLLANRLSGMWNQSVVVENKPGASGTIAVNEVAKAAADGYTMVLGAAGNLVVAHKLIKDLPYDVLQDLKPVTLVAAPPFVLVTSQESRFKNVQDLLQYAQQHPGEVTYGSAGVGSANHLSGEMLGLLKNVEMMHVAYKGMGPAINDLIGGRTDFAFAPIPLVLPQIEAGKLRALGVTGRARSKVLADVPTVAESGVKDFESGAWFAVMVPDDTPDAIVNKLNADIKAALQDKEVIQKLAAEGADPIGNSPEEALVSLNAEMKKWGDLIEKLKLQPN